MLDFLISILILVYFNFTQSKHDSYFNSALIYNILHILLHFIFIIPIINKFHQIKTSKHIKRQYLRSLFHLKYVSITYIYTVLILSLCCVYSLISELFLWQNYGYLLSVFCLLGSSLKRVSDYTRIIYDWTILYSVESYKFFCFVIGTILFYIYTTQSIKHSMLIICWIYLAYNIKKNIKRQLIYYMMISVNVIVLFSAIILRSKQLQNMDAQDQKIINICAVIFFAFLLLSQLYQFVKISKNYGADTQFYKQYLHYRWTTNQNNQNIQEYSSRQDWECAICLQNILQEVKQNELILRCGHHYHQKCIQGWLVKKKTCPLCRTLMS